MIDILLACAKWWVVVALLGAAAVPAARRIFSALPDRGLAFARPLGLLAAGLVYWLGGMAGLLPNSRLGALLAALAVLGAGIWLARRDGLRPEAWWRENRRLILGYELLFGLAFVGWAIYRGFNPNIETAGGEKYMEMAFISGILESPAFPPLDPWLSGGSISYYYFGYVIAALLTRLAFVPRFEAFNLIVPMTLGLTLLAACGLGWNLAGLAGAGRRARWVSGLLGGLVLALMGSLEGFLELAYIRAWLPPRVFDWLAIKNLGVASAVCGEAGSGYGTGGWVPSRFIWWWRGSRVITDIDPLSGGCREVIHEFPFFSFMLADAHPHVMTLPYALLALALALAVMAGGFDPAGERDLLSPRFLVLPLAVGALGFLNTWDLPTYGFVLVCAWALRTLARPASSLRFEDRALNVGLALVGGLGLAALGWRASAALLELARGLPPEAQPLGLRLALVLILLLACALVTHFLWSAWRRGGAGAGRLLDALRFAVWLGSLSIAFYLPFYLGFGSQASGFALVDVRTRLPQWLVHFGPLFWLACGLVGLGLSRLGWRRRGALAPAAMTILIVFGLTGLYALFLGAWTALVLASVAGLAGAAAVQAWSDATLAMRQAEGGAPGPEPQAELAAGGAEPRDADAPAPLASAATSPLAEAALPVALGFALLCVAVGLLMPLGTEFLFVRDLFGSRMNSIFKLYYQAWTLLAVGGSYGAVAVWRALPRRVAWAWTLPTLLLIAGGAVFSLAATYTRTNAFSAPQGLSLDGLRWWRDGEPGDLEAAAWISANTPRGAVLLEAFTDGGYAHIGRMAMATGRPTLLGWAQHEHQWRGNGVLPELEARKSALRELYGNAGEAQARELLDQYGVDYVVVGNTERARDYFHPASEERFGRMMQRVFTSSDGQTQVFARRAATQ